MLVKIAKAIGWKTWYHISCTWPIKGGGMGMADLCISVKPWIRQGDGMQQVRQYLFEEAKGNGCTTLPSITSITRIGA
jgi:hypothetical protein